MFLRFYGQPAEKIDRCIALLRERDHEFTEVRGKVTTSTNPIIPANSVQVDLTFTRKNGERRFMKDPMTKVIYLQHANGTDASVKLVGIKPGQTSFKPVVVG